MNLLARLTAIILAGCSTPVINQRVSPGGRPYTEMIDMVDNPCGSRGWAVGCFAELITGPTVYYSSVAPDDVRRHEVGHVDRMRHTPWAFNRSRGENCSVVTQESTGYPLGSILCVTQHHDELILPRGSFTVST